MATKTESIRDSVSMKTLKFTTESGKYVGHGIEISFKDDTGRKRKATFSLEAAKALQKMLESRIDFTELCTSSFTLESGNQV